MKKLLLLLTTLFILSCSKEEIPQQEQIVTSTLHIPEMFRGNLSAINSSKHADIYENYFKVDTSEGLKTITQGDNEKFNGVNLYQLDLKGGGNVVLLKANGFISVSVFSSTNGWIVSESFRQ